MWAPVEDWSNFCNSCGERVEPPVLETVSAPSPSPRTIVSFDEFYAKKSLERMNRFEPKSRPSSAKKRRFAPSSTTTLSEVSINVGYMELDNQGKLKKCRGKNLPVRVSPTARKTTILEKAVEKHAAFDKKIIEKVNKYVLLFPDCTEVAKIPGTEKEFILQDFRKEIGKNFNRLTLFIAKKSDFSFSELPNIDADLFEDDVYEESGDESDNNDIFRNPLDNKEVNMGPSSSDTGSTTTQMRPRWDSVECPTCRQSFPFDVIADHADLCCDVWVGEVTEENPQEGLSGLENQENDLSAAAAHDFPSPSANDTSPT